LNIKDVYLYAMRKIIFAFTLCLLACSSVSAKTPKYIFLMFGDGMGIGSIMMAENYKSWINGQHYDGKLLNFREFPYQGYMTTYAADNLTTGSSEAATAMFCGVKGNSGYIGMDANQQPYPSVATILHERGYQIGVMSTDPLNHATPAAMYAHTPERWVYHPITCQLPASGFEFFCGDSFIDFWNTEGELNADQVVERGGYTVCYGYDEFKARPQGCNRLIVCNPKSRDTKSLITADIDKNKKYILTGDDGTIFPSDQLRICLEYFDTRKPFLVLCEEGHIDHCAHNNEMMGIVNEVLKLEDAVSVALDFYRKHPKETLIIVFADHETGGLTVNGWWWPDWEEIRKGNCDKVIWATHGHTAMPTPVFAIGAGADRFNGSYDNTAFFGKLLGK